MDSSYLISAGVAASTVIVAVIAMGVIAFVACFFQTKKLKVTRVFADKEGESSPICRVGLISDLHFPRIYVNTDTVISKLAGEDCDVILIAGDLCQIPKGKPEMLAFMRRLAEELPETPILVVPGNHDAAHVCKKDPVRLGEYCREIENCGKNISVLRNQVKKIPLRGSDSSIVAAGFEELIMGDKKANIDTFNRAASLASEKDKLLLLMHNPDIMEHVSEAVESCGKYSFTAAGHTHGGQVYMPFNFEFNILRDDRLPKKGFIYGLYEYCGNNKLYITCGLGQSFLPVRLGTEPEIAFICF